LTISPNNSWDVIANFTLGRDKIDLSTLPLSGAGPAKLVWTGATFSDADSRTANAARAHAVWTDATHSFLFADTDGDGKADLKIQVKNVGAGDLIGVTKDTTAPTVKVNIVDASLSDGDSSSVVTFTFSEVPVGFTASDVVATGGTLSGLTQDLAGDPSGKTYKATFTAADGFTGTGTVSVASGSYTTWL
jgi:hypothetical protein